MYARGVLLTDAAERRDRVKKLLQTQGAQFLQPIPAQREGGRVCLLDGPVGRRDEDRVAGKFEGLFKQTSGHR